MRIAIDLTALNDNFSGIERYALNLTLALLEADAVNTYDLVFKNEIFPDFLPYQDRRTVRIHILPGCGKLRFNQLRLPHFLNQIRADCFLFPAFPVPFLFRRRQAFGAIHDLCCFDCPETMRKHMAWYFRLSYLCMARRTERIVTISEFSRGRIRDVLHVPEQRILLAYCAVSNEFFQPSGRREADIRRKYHLPERYFLCLSTLEPRKNLSLLLTVYLELYREGRIRTKLVLAGRKGWKVEELLREADAAAEGQVIRTGFIEDEDLPGLYRLADCFLFPSLYEGFGIPPLEAMSQGTPVLASDSSSMPEVLGKAAMYFRNNDAADLKRALIRAEGLSQEERERMKQAGMERSRSFRYSHEAAKILHAIQGLVKTTEGRL